jgi:hypothetical protein
MNKDNANDKKYKRMFHILVVSTLVWSILFFAWMVYNFTELDNINVTSYLRCFVHTTVRKTNFMKINLDDCRYAVNNSFFKILKHKIIG